MLPLSLSRPHGRPLRVLCLGAHSDDIEIGCGGTVLRLVAGGARVHWAVFSGDGQRADEAGRSARLFLGRKAASQLTLARFRDGFFPAAYAEVKEACEALAERVQPDVVLTHGRSDRHQDHRLLSDLAWNTFRRQMVLEYEIPKWDGDMEQPNCYVALPGQTARRKIRALMELFATQRSKDWFDDATFLGLMRLRGVECRAPSGYAEAFVSRKFTVELSNHDGRR
jgi:LmbE family N-acetylglucosaminyl deacetylase